MITLTSTTHAYRRARERLRWPRRAVDRMLNRIFYDGLGPSECPAVLDLELTAAVPRDGSVKPRVYGDHLFLFARPAPDHAALMTVYPVSPHLRAPARRARRHHLRLAA
jgi:hypothetical protein